MAGSKSRGHFRKRPKKIVVVPVKQPKGRTHMEKEKDKPIGPPPSKDAPPEGPRESPLGPGEHQKEPPADEKA